jgi:hypothetical protein
MATARSIAKMLARGDGLSSQEQQQLFDYLAINETVRAWVEVGASYPKFNYFEADSGCFDFIPLEMAYFQMGGTQTIPNAAETSVQFNSASLYDSRFTWDSSANPERISVIGNLPGRVMVVCGTAQFDPNNSGYRGIYFRAFDSDDVQLSGATLIQLPPPSGVNPGLTFAYPYVYSSNAAYFDCTVRQTSGGNLDLNYLNVGLFRVF